MTINTIKDLAERLVQDIKHSNEIADKRFGGFQYGNNYVVRDFVEERKDIVGYEHPFSAPIKYIPDENAVLQKVKDEWIAKELEYLLRALLPELKMDIK